MADSGTAKPGAHASKTTRAHADAAHPTEAHSSTAAHPTKTHPTTVAYPTKAHPTTVAHPTHSTTVAAPTTHSGRRIKRRTGDDGRRRGQGDYDLTHHDASSSLLQTGRALCRNRAARLMCVPRTAAGAKTSTTESIGQDCDTLK
jgi:hypothetical protein